MSTRKGSAKNREFEELKSRLSDAEEALRAIQQGEVDALVVTIGKKDQVFTLQGADQAYRLVMEQMNEGVVTLTSDGIILYSNQRFADMLHIPLEKVISSNFLNYVEPQPQDHLRQIMEKDGRLEVDLIASEASTVPVYLSMKRLTVNEMSVICVLVTDLTEQKMKDHIIKLKDDFIGMVSHELNTPLTVIVGSLYTAMLPKLPKADNRELLLNALKSAEELEEIVGNLLELSRAQSDQLQIIRKVVDMRQIAKEVVRRLSVRTNKHRITVEMKGLPKLAVDPLRISRILYNLGDNAIKYSPDGCDVTIFARADHDDIIVGVRDHGIGISPKQQAKLFRPFERFDMSPQIKGIGLGLIVVDRLVKAHGGRVWVESAPGKGSTFYFTLPLGNGTVRATI